MTINQVVRAKETKTPSGFGRGFCFLKQRSWLITCQTSHPARQLRSGQYLLLYEHKR